jgi:hypothetical protein
MAIGAFFQRMAYPSPDKKKIPLLEDSMREKINQLLG